MAPCVRRVLRHHAGGADHGFVQSRVANLQVAPPRYVQARHELDDPPRRGMDGWMHR